MHFERRPELWPPPHLLADPRNVTAPPQKIALARLGPQREHEQVNIGGREIIAHDEGTLAAELLVDDAEEPAGMRLAPPRQDPERLVRIDRRPAVKGEVDRRIEVAAHEGEPGQVHPMVIAAWRRR